MTRHSPGSSDYVASCFISYNHADRDLARALADGLHGEDYHVWIDQGELKVGDSLITSISAAIDRVDFLLALVSTASVGSSWCHKEISLAMTGEIAEKGITVLPCRVGDVAMPPTLVDKLYLDISPDDIDSAIRKLDQDMRAHLADPVELPPRRRATKPPAQRAQATPRRMTLGSASPAYDPATPVKMIGVDVDGVSAPRNDGSRGSALYTVPIKLDVAPDSTWVTMFKMHWDRPPQFTSMHRPGIASVSGDGIRLAGTTLEEVQKYHLATLKLAVAEANKQRASAAVRDAAAAQAAADLREEHARRAHEIASQLDFD